MSMHFDDDLTRHDTLHLGLFLGCVTQRDDPEQLREVRSWLNARPPAGDWTRQIPNDRQADGWREQQIWPVERVSGLAARAASSQDACLVGQEQGWEATTASG